ncbi:sensor histidine kinase [Novosphingobium sp. PhB165]|uniref:sensor histidine kinase n=1 Tax=Novosphingobium sp. PhB165 TaxID=2485105 RepID=UPI0014049D6B|nr:sensor histidine kinase [Novosphingobium sp. PhB165]
MVGLVQEFVLALPMDLFTVGHDGTVLTANLSHTIRSPAGLEHRRSVIGAPFENALDRLPIDDESRREICAQLNAVLRGTVLTACRCYRLLASDPDMLTVQATRMSGRAGQMLVVLQRERSTVSERCGRRAYQAQFLRAQDEERRRIARDLHDGTAQYLALAQVMLEAVRKARTVDAMEEACADIESALSTAQHQMRTLSYVLHPPELEAGGIVEALGSFLKGFARRTGLRVRFRNLAGYIRPSADLEIALYRVAQEALVNVGKHAFASTVEVRLRHIGGYLVLEIEDDGIGISADILEGRMREAVGVGLVGMRERVEGLGGVFCVERGLNGTQVSARFPQRRAEDLGPARAAGAEIVTARRYCSEPRKARVPPSS